MGVVELLTLTVLTVLAWQFGAARVTGGVYKVVAPDFVITAEDLDCSDDGVTARCRVPVDGSELLVTITLGQWADDPCHATHRGVELSCLRSKDYAPGSDSVLLDGLEVSPAEAARWNDAVRWWWRVDEDRWIALGRWICCGPALFAAVLGWYVVPRHLRLASSFVAAVCVYAFSAYAVLWISLGTGLVD
ncbi:hypothetical protein [Actinosynnema sp. NPDC020468]|uniref:hypothetical protein n=1 Tax=Actinosynnema sp. NPDC020468 TaxID=3154488 RepID=UPI0033F619B9